MDGWMAILKNNAVTAKLLSHFVTTVRTTLRGNRRTDYLLMCKTLTVLTTVLSNEAC